MTGEWTPGKRKNVERPGAAEQWATVWSVGRPGGRTAAVSLKGPNRDSQSLLARPLRVKGTKPFTRLRRIFRPLSPLPLLLELQRPQSADAARGTGAARNRLGRCMMSELAVTAQNLTRDSHESAADKKTVFGLSDFFG